jgi:chitinase
MTYDINGAWNPETGANSPLDAPNGNNSFNSAIDFWISSGVPSSKLTGGLPFYGRSTTAKEDMTKSGSLYQDQLSGGPPKGDSDDTKYQDPNCSKDPGGLSGIWKFGNLISQGVLDTPTTTKAPWVRTWDDESSTPWLFNPSTKVFISYDDPLSIAAKVKSAQSKGLAGVMVWSVDQDSEAGDLLKAISQSI